MSVNDYFDYEFDGDIKSQADEIVHEAKDKLVDLIYENVKSEIERYKNWYESAAEVRDKLQKRVYEQAEQIKVLEIDLKRTKEELERKDNEIPKVPFMPGDKVWWIGNDSMNEVTIKCPICEGKGKVKTQTTDYGEVEIICPHCKGNSTTRYEPAKAYQGYVVRTRITLDAADDVPGFIYDLVRDEGDLKRFKNNAGVYTFSSFAIYKTKEEADKVANQETEIRRNRAMEKYCTSDLK